MTPPLLGNLGTKFSEMSFPHFKTYYTQIGRCYLFNTQQLKMIDSKNFTLSSMSSFQNAWPIIWKKKLQKFTNNYWIKDCNFNWVIFGLNQKSWLDCWGKRWKSAKNNAFNRTAPLKVLFYYENLQGAPGGKFYWLPPDKGNIASHSCKIMSLKSL